MKAINKLICSLLSLMLLFTMFSDYVSGGGQQPGEMPIYSSYRDVPGVTEDEIKAIEALREKTDYFVYGMTASTETFRNTDGEIGGYTTLLCEWLTELFGIPFIPELYIWNRLLEGLKSGSVDFTGELTATEERRNVYYMTDAIAERMVKLYSIAGNAPLSEIAASRPLRYAFLEGAITINYVMSVLDDKTPYELFFVRNFDHAYSMLKNGEIDAFFSENNDISAVGSYGDVVGKYFFPPISSPVSMSTQNPELKPIIDLVQKALQNGESSYLDEMYSRGNREYLQHTLLAKLTEEEREYIRGNPVIPYVTQYNNYPMSFYNENEKQWQGIAFDLLNEIEELTGLSFQLAHGDEFIRWPYLLAMVENRQAAFVTELIRTEARRGRFIWLDTTLATEYLTLVSVSEKRTVRLNEVKNLTVGVVRNTAQTEAFMRWFPNHNKIVEYNDTRDALLGMGKGEVDLVMTSTSNLLVMKNYLELTGYKANIVFDDFMQESTFGFNPDEVVLCSIIDKALSLIDAKLISDEWKNRSFDYRYRLIEAQRPWLFGIICLFLMVLVLLSAFFVKSRNAGKRLEKLVKRRTSELALQTSMLHTMVDSIPDHVFCKDLNSNYILCNKIMLDYYGRDKDDVIGKGEADGFGIPDEMAEKFINADRKVIGERRRIAFEEWIPSLDGDKRLYETIKAPLMQDGAVVGIVGIAHDITERKTMEEEARSASLYKSAFLATMSHEIRTPMNSIMGFAELALDRIIEPQIKDYLCKITDNTKWLLHIINDILDISKIEAGKMDLEHAPFDLYDVFSRCESVILPSSKEKGLELKVYAEPIFGKRLLGDPVRLYQVLINLLSNAVKFTDAGTVKFSSSVKDSSDSNATVYFEVKDSGIGMNREQIEKIFDPFVQADSSTTRDYGGTGLGLAIAKNLVGLMGGKLVVESEPGLGSTFSFEIVFETIDVSDDAPHVKLELLEKPRFDGLILICDDNPMNRELICEHLARVGLRTVVAENGKEGVEKVAERIRKGENPFCLILMDIFMPVMDGMEAASKIRKLNTGTPIVAMTANIMAGDLEKYRNNGMPECLGKPFTSQELWRVLLKYLTPVSSSAIDEYELTHNDELQKKLRINFVKNHQTVYTEITDAVAAGDVKLAHRIAHTLKGNAGQIGELRLQAAAATVETMLSGGENLLTDEQSGILESELRLALEKLSPLLAKDSQNKETLDDEKIRELFDKLEPMIRNKNPESIDLLDSIRAVPGTEELARQVENFEFKRAIATLSELRINKSKSEKTVL